MSEITLQLYDEMIERAEAVLAEEGSVSPQARRDIAERVVRAAFEDVPLSNYSIGTLLQFFELVIAVAPSGGAGVYRVDPDDPSRFDALVHKLSLSYGHEDGKRWVKYVQVSGIEP